MAKKSDYSLFINFFFNPLKNRITHLILSPHYSLFIIFLAHYSLFIIKKGLHLIIIIPHLDPLLLLVYCYNCKKRTEKGNLFKIGRNLQNMKPVQNCKKSTKYETRANLHRFHILYISRSCTSSSSTLLFHYLFDLTHCALVACASKG